MRYFVQFGLHSCDFIFVCKDCVIQIWIADDKSLFLL